MVKASKTRILVESALMLAIALVLSLITLIHLPYGGSVTVASMLPIIVIAYRFGMGPGLLTGLAYGIIQQLLGLKNLSYVTGWQSVLAVILLDYLIAFTVLGFGGIFSKKSRSQAQALVSGTIFVCVLRFICHVISGATVWAGISIPTTAALVYSMGYNATYMIPETVVTALAAYFIGISIDLCRLDPALMKTGNSDRFPWRKLLGALLVVFSISFAVVLAFSKLQDPETGSFMISGLKDVNWILMLAVSVPTLAGGIIFLTVPEAIARKKETTSNE